MSGNEGGIDFSVFWGDVAGNMDVTADDLLNMWTEFTRPGSVNIFILDQVISSWTGDDIYISANIVAPNSSDLWNVQLWAGATDDDESGMFAGPVDVAQTDPGAQADFYNANFATYAFGGGTLDQDAAWLGALYGGWGGGSSFYGGFSSFGSFGDFGGFNSYGVYSEDNIY